LDLPLELMQACETINNYQDSQLAERVITLARERNTATIGILGLAFKPDTPVIVESPAIKLTNNLLSAGFKVVAYDPLAMENAKAFFGETLTLASSVAECLDATSLCVLTVPSKELAKNIYAYSTNTPKELIDCWRILDNNRLPKNIALA
jgi:UDPglucose 6-dehydrogenase